MRSYWVNYWPAGAKAILVDPHFSPVDPDDPTTGDWTPIEHRLYRPPCVALLEMAATFDWLSQDDLTNAWPAGDMESAAARRCSAALTSCPRL